MKLNSSHVIGFAAGVAASAACFYFYKRNQAEFDAWLSEHGIEMAGHSGKNPENMTLEELMIEKELFEDIIAEREMAQTEEKTEE
ncbi:MAG: hypothetical protein MI863_12900 [Desulfobacterales bacterium]|nr:hypothetical protein [Desulfobacterales bacterium]